ncbi:flagellar hook-length control protein FliK [Pararhodobacter oceanensis]|uniref:Flagellar hook-length control protein-like C-terminal domain-containing protein n=1 Tax=Pararhodobacter oceanensis TaxID=2172121 RepID=A0A2T8HSY3_9RHOB|nr:flagellar hook-length control protein FliK [Pararhodobacter oceanensis]PVH28503.1 hypothetical protein DDE20_13115 [Pararhodobacter oceanensis]
MVAMLPIDSNLPPPRAGGPLPEGKNGGAEFTSLMTALRAETAPQDGAEDATALAEQAEVEAPKDQGDVEALADAEPQVAGEGAVDTVSEGPVTGFEALAGLPVVPAVAGVAEGAGMGEAKQASDPKAEQQVTQQTAEKSAKKAGAAQKAEAAREGVETRATALWFGRLSLQGSGGVGAGVGAESGALAGAAQDPLITSIIGATTIGAAGTAAPTASTSTAQSTAGAALTAQLTEADMLRLGIGGGVPKVKGLADKALPTEAPTAVTPTTAPPTAAPTAPEMPNAIAALASNDGPAPAPLGALSAVTAAGFSVETLMPLDPATPATRASPAVIQSIAQQLAPHLPAANTRGFEIALAPEELGRVRMRLTGTETQSTLIIQVERPETLVLMRQHITALEQDLRLLGHDNLSVRFAGESGGGATGEQTGQQTGQQMGQQAGHQSAQPAAAQTPPDKGDSAAPSAPEMPDDHLDLRL